MSAVAGTTTVVTGGAHGIGERLAEDIVAQGGNVVIGGVNRDFGEMLSCRLGEKVPSFVLKEANGKTVPAPELLSQGLLVVSFYRGVWCPYCNMELQASQEALPAFRELGAQLVAISPQNAVNSRKSQRANGLDFPILSDPGNETAAAFGLRFALPDYLIELYKSRKNDLPAFNGDTSWTLPMPGRFVIGQGGVIRYAEVNPDYTRRPEPSDLLPALRGQIARAA
jgi:peroxiredoxin